MDIKKNFKAQIIASVLRHPTLESIAAKSQMDKGEQVLAKANRSRRDFSEAKVSVKNQGGLSSLIVETNVKRYGLVSEEETPDDLKKKIDDGQDIDDVLSSSVVISEEDLEGATEFTSGDTVRTLLGNFTVITMDDEDVILIDQNNETVAMSREDFGSLAPVLVEKAEPETSPLPVDGTVTDDATEGTQVPDVPGPADDKVFKATYTYLDDKGEEREEQISASTSDELDSLISDAESDPDFINLTSITTPYDESADVGPFIDLTDDDTVSDTALFLMSEQLEPGSYVTDMGKVKVHGYMPNGTLRVTMDGKTFNIEISDLELLHPKKSEETEEDETDELLKELNESTGIKGTVSKDGRYVRLSGGRLRAKAYLETRDLQEYVSKAKSGVLNATKSFRWRG